MLTWEGAYRVIGWKAYQFPAPSHVLDSTLDMLNIRSYFGQPLHSGWPWRPDDQPPDTRVRPPIYRSPLVVAQLVSGTRLAVGFSISILIGATLGLLMWRWRGVDEFFGPLFLGMQTLPSVCWIPMAILTFGINESGILFVLVMGSCFAIAIALRDGLRTIPPVYQKAGLMLGAGGWRLYRYVLLPASLPAMTSSLRQGFSFAWRSLMGAELIFMVWNHGLGFLLHVGREFSDISQVIAVMAMMVIVGMIVDRWVFAVLEKRVHARFGLSAGR
ncbi:MAG: ABC transporter permease [Phycisphaerales bacterium]|nr:ABC transporter permease [Phycisphaerales bacterium]